MDEQDDIAAALGDVFASVEVSHVIVRACVLCGAARTQDDPCAGCGNLEAPVVADLGVTNGVYRDSGLRALWSMTGLGAAERRIRRANAQAALLRTADPSVPPERT